MSPPPIPVFQIGCEPWAVEPTVEKDVGEALLSSSAKLGTGYGPRRPLALTTSLAASVASNRVWAHHTSLLVTQCLLLDYSINYNKDVFKNTVKFAN